MIAIGGVIGAGLFVGSGAVIAEVGPAAFITYALTGVLIIGNAFRGLDGEFRQR
jgi:GABA permease